MGPGRNIGIITINSQMTKGMLISRKCKQRLLYDWMRAKKDDRLDKICKENKYKTFQATYQKLIRGATP